MQEIQDAGSSSSDDAVEQRATTNRFLEEADIARVTLHRVSDLRQVARMIDVRVRQATVEVDVHTYFLVLFSPRLFVWERVPYLQNLQGSSIAGLLGDQAILMCPEAQLCASPVVLGFKACPGTPWYEDFRMACVYARKSPTGYVGRTPTELELWTAIQTQVKEEKTA